MDAFRQRNADRTSTREKSVNKIELRDYQIEMVNWLKDTKRALCTDHPGLGKTFTSLEATILPALICVPAHLVLQWTEFIQEQYPERTIACAKGFRKERELELNKNADYYVINYEMLSTYALPTHIKTIIFDEAHRLRRRQAGLSKAAAVIANRNEDLRVYMLTATPMWREIDDIWHLLHILYPTIFKSYDAFLHMFCNTVQTPYALKVINIKQSMRKELEELLTPIKWGRTYKDVGRYLPDTIETTIKIQLPDELRKVYNAVRDQYRLMWEDEEGRRRLTFQSAALMHTLRQVTANAGKVDAIKQIVEDNKKPTVCFMWYRDHADMVHKALKGSILLTGEMDPRDRTKLLTKARQTKSHIVSTIGALTEGANLSEYRQVIYGEQHHAPGANYQTVSRIVRDRNDDGRDTSPVLVYYVLAERTIDEGIYKVVQRRITSIKDVISECLL